MNKLNAVIIEDEIPAARLLHSMVHELRPAWDIATLPGSVDNATAWFASNPHPDLLFLDIQLADGSAFDFLSAARPTSAVIFTTAYDQYAIRAFSVDSIDYILKPVDRQRLLEAIVKYESRRNGPSPDPETYVDLLLDSLTRRERRFRTRFLIYGADSFKALPVTDIAYFYSQNKITFAVTFDGRQHSINLSLNKLGEQLDPEHFFRANRQTIVNIDAIDRAEPFFNGKIVLSVHPPHSTPILISEEKVSAFKLWLDY